jgi:hypothetical protein
MRAPLVILVTALCASWTPAQLADVQPGRNYPVTAIAFGAESSADIELGDVDNDGDLDVLVANGGNAGPQQNRIYINEGGAQGGTAGSFTEGTAVRFAGVPVDRSRDADFVDMDGDGDIDVYVSNRGTGTVGEVSRAYTNLGGIQAGPVGFFTEGTDGFWGKLVSVLPSQEVGVVDGEGPWGDWACDCDFGDLDDDGDLDLFHSTYGPNLVGSEPSRVFLNAGDGRFDELWPWVDPAGDPVLVSLEIEIADLDGDFDLDLLGSSRDTQARLYRNELRETGWSGSPFTDVTQTALIDTGAAQIGTNSYGSEYGDIDGDGDFDLFLNSYQGFSNHILRNDGGLQFTKVPGWLRGEKSVDDNPPELLDFDGDGDLDAFVSGFAPGANEMFTSGVAQGLTEAEGLLHRNGTSAGGSVATWPEMPAADNGGTTWDSAAGDVDNDGDPDLLLGNESGQPNRLWLNALGVPDSHSPWLPGVTVQGDKSDGTDTIIHAQAMDNAGYQAVSAYRTDLLYSVDGGVETCVAMTASGAQLFRGVIPAALNGSVTYRVRVADDMGNLFESTPVVYLQTSSASSPWQNLGCGTEGVSGVPALAGSGDLVAGNDVALALRDAAASAPALLFLSFFSTPAPFKGGTLYTVPPDDAVLLATDAGGLLPLRFTVPAGVPSGLEVYWQYAVGDAMGVGGAALSNAVLTTAP